MSHPTVGLDDVVHQRTRLGILAILSRGDRIEFGYLQDALGLSAGNLSRHLTTLAEARLIDVDKGYQGRRPRTWVTITPAGAKAFSGEVAILRSLTALHDALGDLDNDHPSNDHPSNDHDNAAPFVDGAEVDLSMPAAGNGMTGEDAS